MVCLCVFCVHLRILFEKWLIYNITAYNSNHHKHTAKTLNQNYHYQHQCSLMYGTINCRLQSRNVFHCMHNKILISSVPEPLQLVAIQQYTSHTCIMKNANNHSLYLETAKQMKVICLTLYTSSYVQSGWYLHVKKKKCWSVIQTLLPRAIRSNNHKLAHWRLLVFIYTKRSDNFTKS